ncbi:sialate O-acetylesterase [Seonamhaeicola marinus]|uniref:Sialate O-acetylesterase n=1 Tax=Seonamhaeicola marinus TaxID=1912246 RepID=A0A5D0HUQ4_9FLAO|nr:sialate O-acetylesterase [Seonamhaeicola marinus]TYA74641.1 sialate O-acetylesterase [Seonamhaeicola marinus]
MRTLRIITFICFCFVFGQETFAQLRLPNIFADHMVLQQKQVNPVWGKASKGEEIKVSIHDQTHHTTADKNGNWKVKLSPINAGGPFTLSIEGNTKIEFKDVLVGEVWVCSGQSNMAMKLEGGPGQHIEGSTDAILNSSNSKIRLFTVPKTVSNIPLENCGGSWEISKPSTAAKFSAVGYFFGKRLYESLDIPIGLISTNVGGTPAQAWTPNKTLKEKFPEIVNDKSKKGETKAPSVLYNAMVNPLIPYGIKGTIWYQGEGNRWNPEQYSRLFPEMIKSWRAQWNQGNFPFYFVQIAPFGNNIKGWVGVQQAQLKTMLTTPNTGMAVINDVGYKTRIHPPKKKEVGERLALWALAKDYNIEGFSYSGPVFDTLELKGSKAIIRFKHAPLGLTSLGKPLDHFEIAGTDGVFHPAEAKIIEKGNALQVWSNAVAHPKNVRYGWHSFIEGCLFNVSGLPASAFSTEDWDAIFRD